MAKIFLVEDSSDIRKLFKAVLAGSPHQVVVEATTRSDALLKISDAVAQGCVVACVDGNLGEDQKSEDQDGREVAAAIREQAPGIKILAHSSYETKWGDENCQKPASSAKIISALNKLELL
jgi:CheY-like chemotaxis protein